MRLTPNEFARRLFSVKRNPQRRATICFVRNKRDILVGEKMSSRSAEECLIKFKKGQRSVSLDSKLFYDAEGYTRSFRQDQEAEYRLFFERYGFAVVECLSAAECERTRDDIWKYIEQKLWVDERFRKPPFPSRGDPETWSKDRKSVV